jgi:hypothetical protein
VVLVFQFTASDTGLSHVIAHHISADLIIWLPWLMQIVFGLLAFMCHDWDNKCSGTRHKVDLSWMKFSVFFHSYCRQMLD